MRPSNKTRIIEAAVSLAEKHGIQGVTIEAVAAEVGITKGGVQYHFASKDALMDAVIEYIRERINAEAESFLSVGFGQATLSQRLDAYVRANTSTALGAGELVIFMDGSHTDPLTDVWRSLYDRWTTADDEAITARQRAALLAVDGLWMDDVTNVIKLTPVEREETVNEILRMLE